MDIEKEIDKKEKEIKEMNLTKSLNLNTLQLSIVIGVASSTAEKWRQDGIGVEYIEVKSYGKKRANRVLYPIKNVAKWLILNQVKTA